MLNKENLKIHQVKNRDNRNHTVSSNMNRIDKIKKTAQENKETKFLMRISNLLLTMS